ncbi:MAG TPA: N-acyl-D-glutamate deacylase, partial [Nevskiaceae bacterium]|nr:N-acyl-D-glutamate deacylase [Nevskiaceae bacterium]
MDGAKPGWDILIKNALVFDGTGAAGVVQDVAIAGERVAAMGPGLADDHARRVIDAQGQWLIPGMLDIHTHFDLEVELEPGLPEAVRHGTTTVVVSNCSLGVAFGAQRVNGADPIVDCFARVENVPKHVLKKVADSVTWNDSKDYLDHFEKIPLGPNIVPMIPHSMLRIEVMGLNASVVRDPTHAELARMQELVEKGMREGYVGFSTDALPFHFLA